MSEESYKRRIRDWKRRVITQYSKMDYTVSTYDSGPFHVSICKGRSETRVRFAFGCATRNDEDTVKKAHTPDRCIREVWQISDDGRMIYTFRIHKAL